MNYFFIFDEENGAWAMTQPGKVVMVLLIVVAMLLTIFIADKKQRAEGDKKISPRQLAFCGVSLALAFVLSSIPFLKIHMPLGGSITLFTMFMICYTGYLFGARVGLLTAFAYSMLQFWGNTTYILSPFQVCCDYLFAFTALGIAGLWMGKKHGETIGFIVACILRGLFHTIGGYLYWMEYMPEDFPEKFAKLYPVIYNYSYILAEMILTVIVINLPPVKKALTQIAKTAKG